MTVDSKRVSGRREVHYTSIDEWMADAERLAGGPSRTVGNWSLGQIFQHLAQTLHSSIDGTQMQFPWLMKKIFGLIMNKEKMLQKPLPAGYKIPKKGQAQFGPDADISTEEGLAALRAAVDRCRQESHRAEHPVFGELTCEEWDTFHLRHAELHMSFAVPE